MNRKEMLQKLLFGADHVAAINIRLRASVNKPIAVYREVKAKIGTATEYNCKPMASVMGN